MRLALAAVLLPFLLATPAAAQQSSGHEAICMSHGFGNMRCTVSHLLAGNHRQRTSLRTFGSGGDVSGMAMVLMSDCGRNVIGGSVHDIVNRSDTWMLLESTIFRTANICTEVQIFNCRRNGWPVDCALAFGTARVRLELFSQ